MSQPEVTITVNLGKRDRVMKTLLFWIGLVVATLQSTTAQYNGNTNTRYGISFSQFKSQSGFQPGYELHFIIQPSAKANMGIGFFIDNETKEFEGITVTHQRMLFTNRYKTPFFQPFIMYNFIYRKTHIQELVETEGGIGNGDNWVTYTSMEHYLGAGLNINLASHVALECGIGYGLYLGSIKRPSDPDPITREISGTSGSGIIFKTGIGFRF